MLDLVRPGHLLAVLSDGLWSCQAAEAPWPPADGAALPDNTVQVLARLKCAQLRLQLCVDLDPWPWESELERRTERRWVVARCLTRLPPWAGSTPAHLPLVIPSSEGDEHRAVVLAAAARQRPLILAASSLTATQRTALERAVRSHWRESTPLAGALSLGLAQLDLPSACCRLYGDGQAQPAAPEEGWRPVTALSVDLVGSTQLLHSLGAEAYAQRLQAYHDRCRDVVLQFHGSLDMPQGDDGLMAYFGFPIAVENAAAHTLTAAWQLCGSLNELGLQARIGVASGQLAVSAQQAFGPEVHLAARLCAAARPGQILVAGSTCDRVGPGFVLEPLRDPLTLKDFGSLSEVRSLLGLAAGSSGTTQHPRDLGRLVGRRRELDQMGAAWAAACAGSLQVCVVHGEAGIGKSRLLQEFAAVLIAGGHRCLRLAGQSQLASSPFAAVVDALRQHWAVEPDVDPAQLVVRLPELLPGHQREDDDLEDLARLLALAMGDDARPPPGVQRRWGDLLLDCLHVMTAPGPFCLLVDDAHWLDPSTVDMLRRLRESSTGRPLLLVLGERGAAGLGSTMPNTTLLELQRLSDEESRELASHWGAALPEPLRLRIVERAEGIPLYLEESLRMLSQRGAGSGGDMPAKLEDLLMVRLDELGPDRAMAQLISVLGRECSVIHLDALLAQDDPFVERARQQGSLAAVLDSGLLQAVEGPARGYRFKHALIRDAAYGSIGTPDRRRLHGLCARLIERSTPELLRQRPEHLAHHLDAAGCHEQARRAWLAAAHFAASRHAHHEALELAQRALALHDKVPDDTERARSAVQLHLLQASAHIALLGYGSAEVEAEYQAAERAGSRLNDEGLALRIRLGLEACYVMRGDLKHAADLAQVAVAATHWDQDARLALQSRWALANVCFHQGDWRAALAGFDDCLAHYQPELHRRSGVQDPAIMCLGYSSWIHFELGQANEALDRVERGLALAEQLQHPFSTCVALGFAASIKRLCGDSEGAWPHALEAVRVCERGGFQVWLAHAWMARGQLRSDRGDVHGGDEDMRRGYGQWQGGGSRISCATYLITHAEILLRQARTQEAATELGTAWQISEQIGEHYYQSELLRLQGLCAWQSGDTAGAKAQLGRAWAMAQEQCKAGLALRCALSLGALDTAQGHPQVAAQRMHQVLDRLTQHTRCRDDRWARHALSSWERDLPFAAREETPWQPV
jgi:class 3 adenylate cyclase/tetratricopeptide (TPR) repeat protein